MPLSRTLNQDFFKTWTHEMAYVLGYFAADGSMLKNNRGAHFIEFTSIDKSLIDTVQRVASSNHKIQSRERGGNTKTTYRIQIGSKTWFEDLTILGFTQKKSNTLHFPNIPSNYFPDFVRGYFDGDGCVYFNELQYADRKKKRWILMTLFTSGSRAFLVSLHNELKECGVRGGVVKPKAKGAFELAFSHRDSLALYHVMYNNPQVSRFSLFRKKEKLEKAIQVLGLTKKIAGVA